MTAADSGTPDAKLRVVVFDYGAGNLHSLIKTLETSDTAVRVETNPSLAVNDCDALVLPGVGAFQPAAERLAAGRATIRAALDGGLPCLGICLGMQLLFESSTEGAGDGIGVFAGQVQRLNATRVPQIGWNQLEFADSSDQLFAKSGLQLAYFANSFVARPDASGIADVIAWSEHEGDRYACAVRSGHTVGVQFHPEKSSSEGVRFVHAFLDEAASVRSSPIPDSV